MSRFYTVTYKATTLPATNAFDLFEITPADDKPVIFHGLKIAQAGTADYGDAQEEGVPIQIIRLGATVTSGSGGTTPTPRLVSATGTAASFTTEAANTTVATTSGTLEELDDWAWNVRMPETYFVTPEFRYEFVQGQALLVRFSVGPNDAITSLFNATLFVEEIG